MIDDKPCKSCNPTEFYTDHGPIGDFCYKCGLNAKGESVLLKRPIINGELPDIYFNVTVEPYLEVRIV